MLKSLSLERMHRHVRCGPLMLPCTAGLGIDRLRRQCLHEEGESDAPDVL